MKRLLVAAGLSFVLGACGAAGTASDPYAYGTPQPTSSPTTSPSAPAPTQVPTTPVSTGSSVGVRGSGFGPILVDGRGIALYLIEADRGSKSVCYGSCAQNWPPLLTHGAPVAIKGSTQSLLGTTKRTDGTTQVTYDGHPLYFFVADTKPGDTRGQGIDAFGGGWYVVSPAGAKIE